MPIIIKRSLGVVTVSESTRNDIVDFFSTGEKKVHIVPNTVPGYVDASIPQKESGSNFILSVGAHLEHKNLHEFLAISDLWSLKFRYKIVGANGAYGDYLRSEVLRLGLNDRVDFLSFQTEQQLVSLYRNCKFLVFPSKAEGFGIPPLEAIACGAKVIVSDIPVHREVMRAAARYVRLGDIASWRSAIEKTLHGPDPDRAEISKVLGAYSRDSARAALTRSLRSLCPEIALRKASR